MKALFLSLVFAAGGICQPISVGLKFGIPLDRAGVANEQTSVNKERWMIGPTIEARLTAHISVGAEALYRRLGYRVTRNVGSTVFSENSKTDHWEVPIFLKYSFGKGPVRPFAFGGGAFEHASVNGTAGCSGDPLQCGELGPGTHPLSSRSWGGGYLAGAGVEFRFGRLRLAPEFRYTRWLRGYFAGAGSDQPAVLLGIRF
jgi:hypothetical protein